MSFKFRSVAEQYQNSLKHKEIYVSGEILFLTFCVDFSPALYKLGLDLPVD